MFVAGTEELTYNTVIRYAVCRRFSLKGMYAVTLKHFFEVFAVTLQQKSYLCGNISYLYCYVSTGIIRKTEKAGREIQSKTINLERCKTGWQNDAGG